MNVRAESMQTVRYWTLPWGHNIMEMKLGKNAWENGFTMLLFFQGYLSIGFMGIIESIYLEPYEWNDIALLQIEINISQKIRHAFLVSDIAKALTHVPDIWTGKLKIKLVWTIIHRFNNPNTIHIKILCWVVEKMVKVVPESCKTCLGPSNPC